MFRRSAFSYRVTATGQDTRHRVWDRLVATGVTRKIGTARSATAFPVGNVLRNVM